MILALPRSSVLSLLIVPLIGSGLFSTTTVRANTHDNRPKILIHLKPVTSKNACDPAGRGYLADCSAPTVITGGRVTPLDGTDYYYAYLVAARGGLSGITGLQCGLLYQNFMAADMNDHEDVDIFSWNLCATLEFITPGPRAWPRPCGGTIITWAECQTGETAVAGYFYMACYAGSRWNYLSVSPRPVDGVAKVANCAYQETNLIDSSTDLGYVAFTPGATGNGCNPCSGGCPVSKPGSAGPLGQFPDPCVEVVESPPSLALHVTASTLTPACAPTNTLLCSDVVTSGGVSPAGSGQYVYLLGDRGTGSPIKEISFGITYGTNDLAARFDHAGVDVLSWVSCATSESPSELWPAPGSSNTLAWSNPECSTSHPLVAGYFYLSAFSPDVLWVTKPLGATTASIGRCDNSNVNLESTRLGHADFSASGGVGCNPCFTNCESPTPVEVSTWGAIKSLFGR